MVSWWTCDEVSWWACGVVNRWTCDVVNRWTCDVVSWWTCDVVGWCIQTLVGVYQLRRSRILACRVESVVFNIYTRPKKHFKNEQRSKNAAAKKDLIQE